MNPSMVAVGGESCPHPCLNAGNTQLYDAQITCTDCPFGTSVRSDNAVGPLLPSESTRVSRSGIGSVQQFWRLAGGSRHTVENLAHLLLANAGSSGKSSPAGCWRSARPRSQFARLGVTVLMEQDKRVTPAASIMLAGLSVTGAAQNCAGE